MVISVTGCATGFTGGGIPTGRSTILGKVVRAEDPTAPVSNALVSVTITVFGKGAKAGRAVNNYLFYTDSNGTFAAVNVPTDAISSNVSLSVSPPQDALLQPQKIGFSLANKRPSSVVVALPPNTVALDTVGSIKLTELSSTPPPNPSAIFKAQVLDTAGHDMNIVPSLVFDGDLGTFMADGTVTVTPNPAYNYPINNPLGPITGTIDTQGAGSPPTTTVKPTEPTNTGTGGNVQPPTSR